MRATSRSLRETAVTQDHLVHAKLGAVLNLLQTLQARAHFLTGHGFMCARFCRFICRVIAAELVMVSLVFTALLKSLTPTKTGLEVKAWQRSFWSRQGCLLHCRTLAKLARSRGETEITAPRVCARDFRQTNSSCPMLSSGVPFCQSRTHDSSPRCSLTCLLRSWRIRRSHFATSQPRQTLLLRTYCHSRY